MSTDTQPQQNHAALMKDVLRLSVPSILAQLTSTAMEYIDATMVGSLGAHASAAIGLVSSAPWRMGGMCGAGAAGWAVQGGPRRGAGQGGGVRPKSWGIPPLTSLFFPAPCRYWCLTMWPAWCCNAAAICAPPASSRS